MKHFLSMIEYISVIGFLSLVIIMVKRSEILTKVELSFFGLFFGVIAGMIITRLYKK